MAAWDVRQWYQLVQDALPDNQGLVWCLFGTTDGDICRNQVNNTQAYWQLLPSSIGQSRSYQAYYLRNQGRGASQQLSVHVDPEENYSGQTRPGLVQANSSDWSQLWLIRDWGDGQGHFQVTNVGNGTGYNLDVHFPESGTFFMNNDTTQDPPANGQYWKLRSAGPIQDSNFLADITPSASVSGPAASGSASGSASTPSTQTQAPRPRGLSGGDIAGIVIGVVAAICLTLSAGFFVLGKRRQVHRYGHQAIPSYFDAQKPTELDTVGRKW